MIEHETKIEGASTVRGDHVDVKPQRLIRLAEVKQRVGLSRASIYKRMSEGRFPKSRSLGSRCAVWVESEINDWVNGVAAS